MIENSSITWGDVRAGVYILIGGLGYLFIRFMKWITPKACKHAEEQAEKFIARIVKKTVKEEIQHERKNNRAASSGATELLLDVLEDFYSETGRHDFIEKLKEKYTHHEKK